MSRRVMPRWPETQADPASRAGTAAAVRIGRASA